MERRDGRVKYNLQRARQRRATSCSRFRWSLDTGGQTGMPAFGTGGCTSTGDLILDARLG